MAKVSVPDGCQGLDMEDGTAYKARAGQVEVTDDHARALRRGYYGQSGMITTQSTQLGTKAGRWCAPCKRTWQAWSLECPRCGKPTTPAG